MTECFVNVTFEAGESRFGRNAGEERLDGFVCFYRSLADLDDGNPAAEYGPMSPGRARALGQRMARDRGAEYHEE